MGARMSVSLPEEDTRALSNQTYFTTEQIEKLYHRFALLDKDNSGTLNPSEFLAIPEFSMNPLNGRLLAMFQLRQYLNDHKRAHYKLFSEEYHSEEMEESLTFHESYQIRDFFHRLERNEFSNLEIDFLAFVQTLSVFSPKAPIEEKVEFAFLVFNSNGDGLIKQAELSHALQLMVGDKMSKEVIGPIVDRVISECDVLDHDGRISLDEFRRVFSERDMASKMIISI